MLLTKSFRCFAVLGPAFVCLTVADILHCKKSWRSSSIPASGDAGPIQPGVEKSFRHPWRQFYYKYRTFSQNVKCVELLRYKRNAQVELVRW
jgi:hypothetical protein